MLTSMSLGPWKRIWTRQLLTLALVFFSVISGSAIVVTMGAMKTVSTLHYYPPLPPAAGLNASLRLAGSCMVHPVTSGAPAFLLQPNLSLTPDQVKARLMKTATKDLLLDAAAVWGTSRIRSNAAAWDKPKALRGTTAAGGPGNCLGHDG
jgi:subtilisin family serine protease